MRFSKLELLKYGQLEDCAFNFPEGSPDLHIIFGQNEAGKSTTMSAISDLLFEFGHTTPYDFRHDRQLLRVGALLQRDGSELECRRKKARAGSSLIDVNERPIDEGLLAAFLGGQTKDSFHRMFSLDHIRLREGGNAILEAKDDVGQAIFAAGSGLVGISTVLKELEDEIKQIWIKRAGGNQDFHVASRSFEEARGRFKLAQIKPSAWDQVRGEIQELEETITATRNTRRLKENEREQIERRRRTLAPIALFRQAEIDLQEASGTPELPITAQETLREASEEIATAKTKEGLAMQQTLDGTKEIEQIVFQPSLLECQVEIEALREEKGAVDKSLKDLPRRESDLKAAKRSLRDIQKEIGWPEETAITAQERLPRHVDVAELRDLLEKRTALDAVLASANDSHSVCLDEANEAKRELEELAASKDVTALAAALQVAQSRGDLDGVVASAEQHLKRRQAHLDSALVKLAPWAGSSDTLDNMILPTEVETAEAVSLDDQMEEEMTSERRALGSENERHALLDLQRSQMLRDDGAVSPQAVQEARDHRDAVWNAIREHFADGADLSDSSSVVADFSEKLEIADSLADQRYSAAEQSGRLAGLIEELERMTLSISQQDTRLQTVETRASKIKREWNKRLVVAGLELAPRAFLAWLERRAVALEALNEVREAQDKSAEEIRKRDETKALLAGEIGLLNPDFDLIANHSLSQLIQKAQQLRNTADLIEKSRIELTAASVSATNAASRADRKRASVETNIESWKELWVPAVQRCGLDPTSSVPVIRAQLDLLDQARIKIDEIVNLQRRISTMESDVEAFARQVTAIADKCGVPSQQLEAGEVLNALSARLAEASTLSERKAGLDKQIDDAGQRAQAALDAQALAEARLRPLMDAAAVESYELLEPIVERSTRVRALREKIATLGDQIIALGEGMTLDALLLDSEGADSGALRSRSEELQEECGLLSDEIERLTKKLATAAVAFEALDDGPDAATAAADMELARTEMASHAERYLCKRAEVTLLAWAIERYRAEKQTPLLKRASELFSILTLGRYTTLLVDPESSTARLSALTSGSAVVPVGGMSEGTVDQLFLSLRLAAVEDVVAGGIKLPFLADDLFINYDDARAGAGFKVLAELAKTTQVLFFTHHQHLLPIARDAVAPDVVSECAMP
jgi:uncharacterized protein YhaN